MLDTAEGFPATGRQRCADRGAQQYSITRRIQESTGSSGFGFSRQKVYSTFNTLQLPNSTFGIGFPGRERELPGIYTRASLPIQNGGALTLGPNSNFANAGYFQNRLESRR